MFKQHEYLKKIYEKLHIFLTVKTDGIKTTQNTKFIQKCTEILRLYPTGFFLIGFTSTQSYLKP